jgi:hypothetical protein
MYLPASQWLHFLTSLPSKKSTGGGGGGGEGEADSRQGLKGCPEPTSRELHVLHRVAIAT